MQIFRVTVQRYCSLILSNTMQKDVKDLRCFPNSVEVFFYVRSGVQKHASEMVARATRE